MAVRQSVYSSVCSLCMGVTVGVRLLNVHSHDSACMLLEDGGNVRVVVMSISTVILHQARAEVADAPV